MKYFIISILFALLVSFGLHTSSVGAVVSTVSGETRMKPIMAPKVAPDTLKKLVLERKIRETKVKIARVSLSITALEKKLETSKMTKLAYALSQKKLITLKKEKATLELALAVLVRELTLLQK